MKSGGETSSTESSFSSTEKKTCEVAIGFYGPKTIEQTKYQVNQEKSF